MLPAWLVIALVFPRPALEASAFIGFGFPGEVAAILGGLAALCRYRQSSRQRWPWPLSGTRPAT
jgi:hypothetical protein